MLNGAILALPSVIREVPVLWKTRKKTGGRSPRFNSPGQFPLLGAVHVIGVRTFGNTEPHVLVILELLEVVVDLLEVRIFC
jgi:hypothetical protein